VAISDWYAFALQKVAAESYWDGINIQNKGDVTAGLVRRNNRIGFPQAGSSGFAASSPMLRRSRPFGASVYLNR
jgi:hypothetical protein